MRFAVPLTGSQRLQGLRYTGSSKSGTVPFTRGRPSDWLLCAVVSADRLANRKTDETHPDPLW
jgi:hypothetical protein